MTSLSEITVTCGIGVISGTLAGFLGIGGGAVLAPLLALALGAGQHRAQGISLAALLPPVGLPAVLAYRRLGVRVDARLVASLIVGFVLGTSGGAWLAHRIAARELQWIFAGFLLLSAQRAVASAPQASEDARSPPAARVSVHVAVPIGAAAGVMSGLLGVGGGLVTLPLLKHFGRLGRLEAQATTLAMLLPPIGLPAVYIYAREQGGLPWVLLGSVGIGFALGAGLGARLAERADLHLATRVYAAFLVLMAGFMVLHG